MSLLRNIKEKSDAELENILFNLQKKLSDSKSFNNFEIKDNLQRYIDEINAEKSERAFLNNKNQQKNDIIETDPALKDVPFVPPTRIIPTF